MRHTRADTGGDLGIERTGSRARNVQAAHFGRTSRLQMLSPHLRQLHSLSPPNPGLRAKVPEIAAPVPRNFSTLRQAETPLDTAAVATAQQTHVKPASLLLKYLIPRALGDPCNRCGKAIVELKRFQYPQ
jgi:hypothetical protein